MNLVELGRVRGPHGLRGELKVHLHFPESDALVTADVLFVKREDGDPQPVRVEGVRPGGKGLLLKLEGIDDRDTAEDHKGAALCVPRDSLPEPEEDEFYLVDLVGCRVLGPGGPVGEVVEVRAHPTVDTMVVRTPGGEHLEQPLGEHWLERVDLEAKEITLSTLDGMIR